MNTLNFWFYLRQTFFDGRPNKLVIHAKTKWITKDVRWSDNWLCGKFLWMNGEASIEEENIESTWQIYFTWVIGNIFLPDNKIKFLQIETIMEIRLWCWWWRKPWGLLTTFETREKLISEPWEASAIDVEEAHGSFIKAGASSIAPAFCLHFGEGNWSNLN